MTRSYLGRRASWMSALVVLVGVSWHATRLPAQDNDPFGASPADDNVVATQGDNPFGGPPAQPSAKRRLEGHKKADDRLAENKIRESLGNATHLEFIETPLQDAVDFLKDLHGIEIQLDHRALEASGLGADTPLTITLQGVSLQSALELLLSDYDLTYVVRHGVMLITTPEAVAKMIELRVYDAHDLLHNEGIDELAHVLRLALLPGEPATHVAATAAPAYGQPVNQLASTTSDAFHVVPAQQQASRPVVAACSSGSVILPYGNVVVVRASIAEHEAIAELLADMRAAMQQAKE